MQDQIKHYEDKIRFEIDAWDLNEALKLEAGVTVLDARSTSSYEREHIPGALHFPHARMTADHTAQLDRARSYVIYCDGIGCNASSQGALKMARLGFTVKELIGGLEWWKRSGFPTEGGACRAVEGQCGCG